MWSRRFKGGEISEYGLKFSRKLAELVGRKLEMAPNRMFQQLTDKTKKKQEIFKNFQATTVTNRCNPPLPPSLTGFNIQASVTKIVTSGSRESP